MNFLADVSLADKTTFRIGGRASYYCEPLTIDDIHAALDFSAIRALELAILGRGSNVLVSDYGWPGLVINLARHWTQIRWSDKVACCQSGALLHELVRQSVDRSFSGIEQLAGIPGTIGGAVIMNAGAFDQSIGPNVEWVEYLDPVARTIVRKSQTEMEFGYRSSMLKGSGAIVLCAQIVLNPGEKNRLQSTMNEILSRRKTKQPIDLPNCGSVFKRPQGNFAGTLIEQAGLKGMRIGGAEISQKHANFIVNTGSATASDVRSLIVVAKKKVYEQTGIILEPEVIFMGRFDEPL